MERPQATDFFRITRAGAESGLRVNNPKYHLCIILHCKAAAPFLAFIRGVYSMAGLCFFVNAKCGFVATLWCGMF